MVDRKHSRSKKPGKDYFAKILGLDLRSLGLFRIGIAVFVLYDLISRCVDLTAHYTDSGAMPRAWAFQYFAASPLYRTWNPAYLAIHFVTGTTIGTAVIFLVHAAAAVALLLGYRTGLMTFLVWYFVSSLHARNPLVLSVGDDVLRVLLFFSIFLPLGERFSILETSKARELGLSPEVRASDTYFSVASAAYYLQFICIYFFSALLKSGQEWRSEGTALYYAFNIDQFALPAAKTLLQHPSLLKTLTFAAWWIELVGGFILLVPQPIVKLLGILLLAGLQFGIGATLALGHNPWINTIVLLPFIPSFVWNRWHEADVRSQRPRWQKVWWKEGLAAFFLLCVVIYNTAWVVPMPWLTNYFELATLAARLEQYWGMFAPAPNRDDGWYVIEGVKNNGSRVDTFHERELLSYEKPASAVEFYPNERWRRYMMNIGTRDFKDFRLPFLEYLCARSNASHSGNDRLQQIRLFFMREVTPPPGQQSSVQKLLFFEYTCRQ
jgi:hypothetical protein